MNWFRKLFIRRAPRVDFEQEMLKLKIKQYQEFYRIWRHEPCIELEIVRCFLAEHNAVPE